LAQRLSPGVQQRGGQMAAQQAQQAMQGGGLPQLPAPNMAGMAGGGIVAFAKGGLPTAGGRDEDEVVTYDELGNPIYASDIARAAAAGITDTSEEGAARRAAYAALQRERPNLSEIARTPERPSASKERVPTSTYGAGDRTGQGVASLISGAAGDAKRFITDAMLISPNAASSREGQYTMGQYATPHLTDENIAAFAKDFLESPLQVLQGARPYPRPSTPTKKDPELEALLAEQMARIDAQPSAKTDVQGAPVAPVTTAKTDAVETLLSQPASSEMGPNATPEQYFRGQFRPEKAQAKSSASAGTSDDRYDRMLAGLRGLGAQGLGGYAAGSAEEKLRMEQQQLAAQERASEEAFREREFGQKGEEITLMNELRRDQLDADIRQRSEQALLRLEALGSAEQQFVQEQIGERTKGIDQIIDSMNLSLITGKVRGGDADELRNQILALQEQKATIMEEALIGLEQPDRSAAIRAAEEAAYGSGGGSGMSEKQRSLLNMYAPQE